MPQFDFATFPSQIFWTIITFAGFYLIVRFGAPRALEQLSKREKESETQKHTLQRLQAELKRLQGKCEQIERETILHYEGKVAEALRSSHKTLDNLTDELKSSSKEMLSAFEEELESRLKKVEGQKKEIAEEVTQMLLEHLWRDAIATLESQGKSKRKFDA